MAVAGWLASRRSPATQKGYRNDLVCFCRIVGIEIGTEEGARRLLSLTPAHAAAWANRARAVPGIRSRGTKVGGGACGATISRKIAAMKSLYNYFVGSGLLRDNPFASKLLPIPPKDTPQARPTEYLEAEEVRAMVAACGQDVRGVRDRAILGLLFGVGLRRAEVLGLRLMDLAFTATGRPFLRLQVKGGTQAERAVPEWSWRLLEPLIGILKKGRANPEDYIFQSRVNPGKPISPNALWESICKLAVRAGIRKRITPHSCRATMITRALDLGLSHREVMAVSGHKSVAMVEKYDKRRYSMDENPGRKVSF